MDKTINIAVDAMGGENFPYKVIKGIEIHNSETDNIFYNIFGNENIINPLLKKLKYQIIVIKLFILKI